LKISKKGKIKEAFKEFWLKYGDYKKCLKELKNIGIDTTKGYLRHLRFALNLPKMHDILLKNKKCFYCGRSAEVISFRCSPTSKAIPICKKCYKRESSRVFGKEHPDRKKIESKKYYKKHRLKILRKISAYTKIRGFYIGQTICPICGAKGYLSACFREWLPTKHKTGPYFFVGHRIYHNGKPISFICNIGRNEELYDKYSHLLPLCNCKKCRLKRGEINESNTEEERI
jgi:hypothetical protein